MFGFSSTAVWGLPTLGASRTRSRRAGAFVRTLVRVGGIGRRVGGAHPTAHVQFHFVPVTRRSQEPGGGRCSGFGSVPFLFQTSVVCVALMQS